MVPVRIASAAGGSFKISEKFRLNEDTAHSDACWTVPSIILVKFLSEKRSKRALTVNLS